MSKKMGRPVEFTEARRETFCALVGVGLSRRQAADYLGIAASTATRCAERDEAFAEQLRQAEIKCHFELLERMRRQCERSWRACVWLLEKTYPELYAGGKADPQAGLTVDQLFDRFVMLLEEEITDEAQRQRLTQRLDQLAVKDFQGETADEPEFAPATPQAAEIKEVAKPAPRPRATVTTTPAVPAVAAIDKRRARKQRRKQARQVAEPISRGGDSIQALLSSVLANRPGPDFCNTSPAAHERRSVQNVSA